MLLLICREGRAGSWRLSAISCKPSNSHPPPWPGLQTRALESSPILPVPGCLDGEGAAPEDSHSISPPTLTSQALKLQGAKEELASVGALRKSPTGRVRRELLWPLRSSWWTHLRASQRRQLHPSRPPAQGLTPTGSETPNVKFKAWLMALALQPAFVVTQSSSPVAVLFCFVF